MKRKIRLLAINFGGIGDEILFLPALKSIADTHSDWHITLLLEPRSQVVLQVTDLCDAVITFDIKKKPLLARDLLDLLGLLKEGDFDLVLSSGSSPAVAALLFLSGIPRRIGYDSGLLSRALLTDAVALKRQQYAAYMYHDLVKGLGIETAAELPAINLVPSSISKMSALLGQLEGDTAGSEHCRVLIHPGTSRLAIEKGIIKTWSVDNWVELIARLSRAPGIQPVLAGGSDDRQTIEQITARAAGTRLISTAGHTGSLADLAALIYLCNLLVCVDSAPMHLSVALGKPLVALFGPTDAGKLLPADARFCALKTQTPVACQTAARLGRRQPAGRQGVVISTDIVFQAVLDQLGCQVNRLQ